MKILKQLGINPQTNLTDYELVIAAQLVLPETKKCQNTWDDIGGLDEILLDVKRKMINPLLHSDVFKHSRLASAPKGALFYGPPGKSVSIHGNYSPAEFIGKLLLGRKNLEQKKTTQARLRVGDEDILCKIK